MNNRNQNNKINFIKELENSKLTRAQKFKKILVAVGLVTALVGGGAVLMNIPTNQGVLETSIGIIYNDENGFTTFVNEQSLLDYCEENNFDIYKLQYDVDSSGIVTVGNSSFIEKQPTK